MLLSPPSVSPESIAVVRVISDASNVVTVGVPASPSCFMQEIRAVEIIKENDMYRFMNSKDLIC